MSIFDFYRYRDDQHVIEGKLEAARQAIYAWYLFPSLEELLALMRDYDSVFAAVETTDQAAAREAYRRFLQMILKQDQSGGNVSDENIQRMLKEANSPADVLSYPISASSRRSIRLMRNLRMVLIRHLPVIEKLLGQGRGRYKYVYEQVDITEVGRSSPQAETGYVIVPTGQRQATLYEFNILVLRVNLTADLTLEKRSTLDISGARLKFGVNLPIAEAPLFIVNASLSAPESRVLVPLVARELKRIVLEDRI